MKQSMLLLSLLISTIICFAKAPKEPAWLTERDSEQAYIGVGSASMSTSEWEQKAEERALATLAQQISVVVENQSFLATMEMDNADKEYFEQNTRVSAKNLLDGHELVGTYKDIKTNTYFVCYQLDKQKYRLNKERKESDIASAGYDYLIEAQNALNEGNLFRSLTYYEKGLAVVEPWLFLDLRITHEGKNINIPHALYKGYVSAFDEIQLTVEPETLIFEEGTTSKEIRVKLTQRGNAVGNMPVVASFDKGMGVISEMRKTDDDGYASFHLTAVTGKDRFALIKFTLSKDVMSGLSTSYRKLLSTQNWIEAFCQINIENKVKIAYLHNAGCDLSTLPKQLTALLGNNHFTLTPDPDEAQIFIEIKNTVDYAGVIPGEIYNLNESYVNLQMKFYDNNNQQLLYTYSVQQLRVLSPEKNSVEQTLAQCTRELMKRVQKELPKKLVLTNN